MGPGQPGSVTPRTAPVEEPTDGHLAGSADNPAGNSPSVRTRRIREVAREVLGFEDFRLGQERAMQSVVAGRDTLAVLPSGAGKTAIYQAAGQLLDGPARVGSPP